MKDTKPTSSTLAHIWCCEEFESKNFLYSILHISLPLSLQTIWFYETYIQNDPLFALRLNIGETYANPCVCTFHMQTYLVVVIKLYYPPSHRAINLNGPLFYSMLDLPWIGTINFDTISLHSVKTLILLDLYELS